MIDIFHSLFLLLLNFLENLPNDCMPPHWIRIHMKFDSAN